MPTLKQQGTKAFIWDFFGKMATHGMGFVVSIFLARLLEPSDFGLIALVMVIIGIANVFTDIGLSSALIQRRKIHPVHYSSVFYFNIAIGVLLTLITYVSAAWISKFYSNPELIPIIKIMSFSFIFSAFSSVQTTRLRKALNYSLLTKINLLSSLISGIFGISLAFYGAGVWSLVTQILTAAIIYNILIWITGQWKPTLKISWKALTQLWGFGFRMFLSGMLDAIFTRMDFIIIGKLFPPATLGYFQRGKSLSTMVVQYSSASLMSVLFPVLSKIQKDLLRFQTIVIKSLGIICFTTFLLLGTLYLISEEVIVLLFSDKWLPSVVFFKIIILSGFSYPISALLVNVIKSRGNSKVFLRLEIYKKLIASVNFIILYYFGINTFLYGLIVQAILGVSLNILFASREINLPFYVFLRPILMQMSIAIFTVILILFMTNDIEFNKIIMLLIKSSLFTLLYILLNYLLKTSSFKYMLEQLMPIVKKRFTNKGIN